MPPTEVITAPFAPTRVLCFAPHPDDEVLGCGGTLHLHASGGGTVRVALATDGAAGDPECRFEAATYPERRRGESRRAAAVLGLGECVFWGLPDSCEVMESDKLRLVGLVEQELTEFEPDIVYLPWRADNNTDHLVLNEVVERGIEAAGFRGQARGYEVWAPIPSPDLVVDISAVLDQKRQALECFETQYAYGDIGHQVLGMNAYRSLLLERSGGFGEAFQAIPI